LVQKRFVDARNDYVKLYTLRQVPLSMLNTVDMEQQTVLYSPTPVDGKPGTVNKMWVGECAVAAVVSHPAVG
jgi:hypothetical protein